MSTLLEAALADLMEDAEIFGTDGLLPARLEPGDPASRVVLATGPNACGKSLACAYLAMAITAVRKEREGKETKGEFFHIGMRMRTSGSGSIGPRTFVYGSEEEDSTGSVSLRAVNGMLQQSPQRGRHVIALDEPEVVSHIH